LETKTDAKGDYRLELPGITKPTTVSIDAMKPGYCRLVGTIGGGGDAKSVEVASGTAAEASLRLGEPALYFAGIVVDEKGKPIPGVQIGAEAASEPAVGGIESTASNADGSFELFNYPLKPMTIEHIAPKPVVTKGTVSFFHPDYVDGGIDDVYALRPPQRASLRIVLGTGHKIAGTLLDVAGNPVPNGMVKAIRDDGTHRKATMTDANGTFVLRGLADGPTTLRAHPQPLKQTVRLPINVHSDKTDLKLRLQPISFPTDLKKYSVLGMQLVDLTPELKLAYDVDADYGALILDPGKDLARLVTSPLAEGFCFCRVGDKTVSSVRQFVNEILAEAARQRSDFSMVRAEYEFNTLDFDGSKGRLFILSKDDLKALKLASAELAKSEQDAIAALQKAGAQIHFRKADIGPKQDRNSIERRVTISLGKKWIGSDADLRTISLLTTVDALSIASRARVSDKALEALRKAAPEFYVERLPEARLGVAAMPKQPDGLHIGSIFPDSPAARAGLREKDVLLEFAGKPIPDFAALRALMFHLKPGQKVDAKLLREKKTFTVTVELGDWD